MKLGSHLLVHLELRGYRSDQDMSVQLHHVAEALLWLLREEIFVPAFVVTIFQGYRVLACSWEVGGRLYAVSRGGVVVALDYPLCHFELRLVTTSCKDAFGMDADRLEFRFLSAADRLDVACSSCSVPPSWLVVSRVSGPTLVRNAAWCRDHYARIESPDQALQLSQLAGIHVHWTAATSADCEEDTGPRISAVAVESHPSNVHLICESPLFHKERALVDSSEALALQQHDPAKERVAAVVPPILDGPAVQAVGVASAHLKSLASGPSDQSAVPIVTLNEAQPSVTEPGQAPAPSSLAGGALAPPRRTLDQRRGDAIDLSAMTPASFVEKVNQAQRAQFESFVNEFNEVEEVTIEMVSGSLDGSEQTPSSAPRSYGPKAQ